MPPKKECDLRDGLWWFYPSTIFFDVNIGIISWLVVWNILYFPIYLEIIIPIDFHIFQRSRYTTNQIIMLFFLQAMFFQKLPYLWVASHFLHLAAKQLRRRKNCINFLGYLKKAMDPEMIQLPALPTSPRTIFHSNSSPKSERKLWRALKPMSWSFPAGAFQFNDGFLPGVAGWRLGD